jgi:transposase InsO family protein
MLNALAVTGNRILFHDLSATITTLPDSNVVLTFDNKKYPPVIKSLSEIESALGTTVHLIPKGQVAAPRAPDLSTVDLGEINRRSAYIDELNRVTKKGGIGGVAIRKQVIARVAREIGDKNPISHSTLARWATKTKTYSHGVASTLGKKTRHRQSLFSQDVQDFALEIIDDYYLQLGNPTVQYAYDCFVEAFELKFGKHAKRPCRETFRKWAKELVAPIEAIERREGRRAAKAAARNATQKLRTDRILERVETDAVNLAIGVTDQSGRYLGTVTIFGVIDVYSRAILGLTVQVGRGESAGSVIDSYKQSICPKGPESLPEGLENDWPMYGVPEVFVSDGGSGYVSMKTQAFLLDAGSQSQIVQTYAGWQKPFIERFFNTLRTRFAQTLHGYCGKYTDRPNLDATIEEKASMTLQEFRSALYEWLVDEYHQTVHGGLSGRTPHEVWAEQAQMFPPHLPVNLERIKFTMGETKICTVSGDHGHQGIQLNNLRYNDREGRLKKIGMTLRNMNQPAKVQVEFTHNDISQVNVIDPFSDDIFPVYVTDADIGPGLTHAEWRARRKSTYANKGFTGQRKAKSSRTFINANEGHDANMRRVRSRQTRPAPTNELEAMINGAMGEESPFETPPSGRDSVPAELLESRSEQYGEDGEYEDD